MPTYEYRCKACGDFELDMPVSEYVPDPACPTCGVASRRVFLSPPNFNLPGDDWTSKNLRIAKQMEAKNRRMKAITEERKRDEPMVKLLPNVGGEVVDSWSEAKKLAASKGKDPSTYDGMIRKEQALTRKIEV